MVLRGVSQGCVVQGDEYSRRGSASNWCRVDSRFAVPRDSYDRKRNRDEAPSLYNGSSRVELIRNRRQSENSLPTDTVEMLPNTHNPQAQPSMFTRQVTKHLSRSLSRRCVGWEMRPHGAHGMGRSL